MLAFEELKQKLHALLPQLKDIREATGVETLKKRVAELEDQAAQPGFWDDVENSQKIVKETNQMKNKIESCEKLEREYEDVMTMIEIALEEQDESLWDDVKSAADEFMSNLEAEKLATLLSGEYDSKNALLTFHAGAGGTEAMDWAQMLYRMYHMWADRHHFKVKLLDYLDGEEAGLKSASILIEGFNAYGFLKSEAGVHRLVRVSPLTHQADGTPPLPRWKSCPKWMTTWRSRSVTRTSRSTPIVPAVQAASMSIRQSPPFGSPIFRPVLSLPARMNAARFKTARWQ